MRQRSIRPKWGRVIVPLVIMLVIVAILLNDSVYPAVVTSDSMSPTLNRGDMVMMTKHVDLQEGDIVLFDRPGLSYPVLHRVHTIKGDTVITKGDFYPFEDNWEVDRSEVYAEAILVGGKPVVLKGVGTYFIEDYQPGYVYEGEVRYTRVFLTSLKGYAVVIFAVAVGMYIFISIWDVRRR